MAESGPHSSFNCILERAGRASKPGPFCGRGRPDRRVLDGAGEHLTQFRLAD
jgi:hypothetical protein